MYWTSIKITGHSSKNVGPSQKTLRPSWWPKPVTGLIASRVQTRLRLGLSKRFRTNIRTFDSVIYQADAPRRPVLRKDEWRLLSLSFRAFTPSLQHGVRLFSHRGSKPHRRQRHYKFCLLIVICRHNGLTCSASFSSASSWLMKINMKTLVVTNLPLPETSETCSHQ